MLRASSLLLTLLICGCASLPGIDSRPTGAASGMADGPQATKDQSQDHQALAEAALQKAKSSDGSERIAALESALWSAARLEDTALLREALSLYPDTPLKQEQAATRASYQGLLLAWQDNPTAAIDSLREQRRPDRAGPQSDYWLAQALAYRQLDDGEAATLMLVRRGALLPEALREENNARIWQWQQEASRFLYVGDLNAFDQTTRGWLELGRIARRYWSDSTILTQELRDWDNRFFAHPAREIYWPKARDTAIATLRSAVRSIALLLPTSGRLAAAASAIRDGFLAAHFGADRNDITLRIYDSSQSAVDSYEQALADGAELIVGPLDKSQVAAVILRNGNRLPILALNYLDQPSNMESVLEYGLAPEDDARSVAYRAIEDGYRQAIALVSEDSWGDRSLQAFNQAFTELGGFVVDYERFHGGARDYPTAIKRLLKLRPAPPNQDGSVNPDPIRRQDAEFLFLAASPQQGRQLRPQLRFYHASDLPVYAPGRIYAGQPDPNQDKDLNGVTFCALPWVLNTGDSWRQRRQAVEQAWPRSSQRLEPFYAMGNDAYLLATTLRNANWMELPVVPGATGTLIREDMRISRRLPCAQFRNGRPSPLPPPGLQTPATEQDGLQSL